MDTGSLGYPFLVDREIRGDALAGGHFYRKDLSGRMYP